MTYVLENFFHVNKCQTFDYQSFTKQNGKLLKNKTQKYYHFRITYLSANSYKFSLKKALKREKKRRNKNSKNKRNEGNIKRCRQRIDRHH